MDRIKFNQLLPKFIDKWTHGEEFTFYVQRFNKAYFNSDREVEKKGLTYKHWDRQMMGVDWFNHFQQRRREDFQFIWGAAALVGLFKDAMVKWVCWDADNEDEYSIIMNKIIPWLQERGINYIIEYSQTNRCHLWVFVMAMRSRTAERLAKQIAKDCGTTGEVYPFGTRATNAIRVIGGWHYWTKGANDIETWDGEIGSEPIFIMESVVRAEPVTEAQINEWCPFVKEIEDKPRKPGRKRMFRYIPMDLPPLMEGLPEVVRQMTCNGCLAYRRLLYGVMHDERIEKPGITYHDTGMKVSALTLFNDIVLGSKEHREGRNLFDKMTEDYRSRDPESHMWNGDRNIHKYEDNPSKLISRCQTLKDQFGLCRGCPYDGMPDFESPRQLLELPGFLGDPVRKKKIGETRIVTLKHIREVEFPTIKEYISERLADEFRSEAISLAHPQGAGKSTFANEHLVTEAIRLGKSVIIAVPTAELAQEHEKRLRRAGVINIVKLLSHDKTFSDLNPYNLNFNCPFVTDIKYYTDLSVSSSYCKRKFCKKCVYEDVCPYPTQYAKAVDPNTQVVIIQHAHFGAEAAMRQIMARRFDMLIIDETFVDGMVTSMKPLELEWQILLNAGEDWATILGEWMRDGGFGNMRIYPKVDTLESIRAEFERKGLDYGRLRTFVEAYNNQVLLSPLSGIKRFVPVADCRILVLTDATLPVEKLQIYLNRPITVFGAGTVLDVTDYHPENKVIGVLDSSASKSRMAKEERFYEVLNYVGLRCSSLYKDDRIVITTYKSPIGEAGQPNYIENPIQETIEYLRSKFPDLDIGEEGTDCRIIVSGMRVGTNAFADFTVQFILASVHLSAASILIDEYHTNIAINHFRRIEGVPEILNIYPKEAFAGEKCNIEVEFIPIVRTEKEGIMEYEKYRIPVPLRDSHKLAHRGAVGKSQQIDRIRYWEGMPIRKIVETFSNLPLEGLMFTEVKLFDQCLAEIGG